MTNLVIMMGILVGNPEVTITEDNKKYAKFTLAVRREYRNAAGDYDADYINVSVRDRMAEIVGDMTHKGSKVEIVGALRTNSYTDKSGIRRKSFEVRANRVQFLDKKGADTEEAFQELADEADVPF